MFPVKKILFKIITLIFLIGCGKPSVYEAVVDGDMEAVKLHLSAGVDVDSAGVDDSHRGKTLLGLAVSNGHNEIAELLINNGASVDKSAGPLKWAPLHFAVWKEQGDLVELLISKKANINSIDVNGSAALHFAAFDGAIEIVSLLIKLFFPFKIKTIGTKSIKWPKNLDHTISIILRSVDKTFANASLIGTINKPSIKKPTPKRVLFFFIIIGLFI